MPMMDSRGVRQSLVRRGRSFDKASESAEVVQTSSALPGLAAEATSTLRFVLLLNTEDIRLLK